MDSPEVTYLTIEPPSYHCGACGGSLPNCDDPLRGHHCETAPLLDRIQQAEAKLAQVAKFRADLALAATDTTRDEAARDFSRRTAYDLDCILAGWEFPA